jgi:hypothetical protein
MAACAGSAVSGCGDSIPSSEELGADGGDLPALSSSTQTNPMGSATSALPASSSSSGSSQATPVATAPETDSGTETGPSATPSSSPSASMDVVPPSLPEGAAQSFPVGLEVRSLLAAQDVAAPLSLRLLAGPGVGPSIEAQIATALAGTTEADCAVQLPSQQPMGSPPCYGPSIEFENHPDGQCNNVPNSAHCGLPGGDLGLWQATDTSRQACTAAKLNVDIDAVGNRVHSALLIAASAACSLRVAGTAMPEAGASADATAGLQVALQNFQPDVQVRSATISNESATGEEPRYLYTIDASLAQRSWKFFLRHTPGDQDAGTYSGRLWGESSLLTGAEPQPFDGGVALNLVGLDGGQGDAGFSEPPDSGSIVNCPPGTMPAPSGNLPPPPSNQPPPPPPPGDAGPLPPPGCVYNPPPNGTNPPPPNGTNPPPPNGTNQPPPQGTNLPPAPQGGDADVFAVHYELTAENRLRTRMLSKGGAVGGAEAFTEDGDLSADGGWDRSMSLSLLDVDKTTGTGKGAYLWQAGPNDDRTRVFNVFTEASASGDLSGCGFFGFGEAFTNDLPKLQIENFICNWAGPNNDHDGVWATAQKQCMAVDSFGLWAPTESHIAYSPQNSCANGDPDFKGGLSGSDAASWTAFAGDSELVSLEEDTDYVTRFGDGPIAPEAP